MPRCSCSPRRLIINRQFNPTQGKDSSWENIDNTPTVGKTAAEVAALCSANPNCDGFERVGSESWLKYSIRFPTDWAALSNPGPCDGLFVRDLPSEWRVWSGALRLPAPLLTCPRRPPCLHTGLPTQCGALQRSNDFWGSDLNNCEQHLLNGATTTYCSFQGMPDMGACCNK